ncbi:NAD(P)H-binding protein [Streptomyces sp. NPDC051018]|uniref:NAD(P)H-binding protein n=1 Tax=Streptomyces sp. NPDC051018 TaxID=3365639 RepID=UPI0037AC02AE
MTSSTGPGSTPGEGAATARGSSPGALTSVLVLGGTGKTGRRVAEELRARGLTPRVASRSAPVRFDWGDRTTWEPALSGAQAVYIVESDGPGAAARLRAFVKTAAEQGVRRLVLLSARVWAELDDDSGLASERAVRESGLEWTILRPTWFAQVFSEVALFSSVLTGGELRLPTGQGREPFIDLADLAEVAAVALTEDGHAGETYVLSGPRALSVGEAVAEVSWAAGRPLRFTAVTEDEYREDLASRGYPPAFADGALTLFRHIREGRGEGVTDGVRRALGREPRDFSEYVRRTDFSVVDRRGGNGSG